MSSRNNSNLQWSILWVCEDWRSTRINVLQTHKGWRCARRRDYFV